MPRRCSIAGCRSNYDNEPTTVFTFSLPKTEPLRSEWLRKIPTDFSQLKNPIVCIKHFDESVIIRKYCVVYKGEYKEYERKLPKLKEGAVRTMFPNLPAYLSSPSTSVCRLADVEDQLNTAIRQSLADYRNYKHKKAIKNINDIVHHLEKKRNEIQDKWFYILREGILRICRYDICDDNVMIAGCIVVHINLNYTVYINKVPVHKRFTKDNDLKDSNEVDDLLQHVNQLIENPLKETKLECAISLLEDCGSQSDSLEIQFIVEQLKLVRLSKYSRGYYDKTLVLAASLYVHSVSAYNTLLKSGLLCVPSIRLQGNMISKYSLNNHSLLGSMSYLKTKVKFLQKHKLIVNILLDEIYIEAQLNFRGGSVYGSSDSDPSNVAKTAQVFMISSILSSFKDVVCIIPVHNLKAVDLKHMISEVITEMEKIGFLVISLISDNNNVNRKAFELLTRNNILLPFISHPVDTTRLLFFLFDSVHIIKCVRNNWITGKKQGTLIFPDMNDRNVMRKADFKHLERMHDLEKTSMVKYGHLLSHKVLFPLSIQKQNVKLALRIFHEKKLLH